MTERAGRGAYGLRLLGYEDADELLVRAAPDWQPMTMSARVGDAESELQWVREDSARLRVAGGGQVEIDWEQATAVFTLPAPVGAVELLHPYLADVAAIAAHRAGREGFHAGGFAVDGHAWAVLGDREAGKSSLLGLLAQRGETVLADDVVILDEHRRALAGPRFIDLRRPAAERLGIGESIGVVGIRERYRVMLGDAPLATPLRGFIALSWGGERPVVSRVPAAERVERLYASRIARLEPRDAGTPLELSALPMLELRRPHDWDAAEAATQVLLQSLEA